MSTLERTISRRALGRRGGAAALAWALARSLRRTVAADDAAQAEGPRPILNRFPRMVQEFHVGRLREIDRKRNEAFRSLKTRGDAERHVEGVRGRIAECFGPLPERTPLHPRVTRVVDRDGYRIENLLFESRPEFLVTANLYLPTGRTEPVPGVVGTCGHSVEGKAAEAYQSFAQGLARQGYACLIYDPIGQGERLQYLDDDLGSTVGAGVREHLQAGNQQVLVGESLASWRAWDGIRALDYLAKRPEVDPDLIGVTGNSGGGTMTTWLAGLDRRWAMAAPSCFVTSFRRNLENELPADIEQCPPRALELGLDHMDFLAAMAPRPVIILAKERDYFDVRGAVAAYRRLRKLYGLLGVQDQVGLFVGPTEHGYSQENREAMYGWFNGVTNASEGSAEPPLMIEPVEELRCTPGGQVGAIGSKTVASFTAEAARRQAEARPDLDADGTRAAVAEYLQLPEPRPRPPYRILRPLSGRGYPTSHAGVYMVPTEPGINALVYRLTDGPRYSRPVGEPPRAILYVADESADEELRTEPLVRELFDAEADAAFYACDLRGIGESRPDTCGPDSYFTPYGSDYFYAAHGLMLGRSVPAQRTFDLRMVLGWLRGIGHREVHLAARGRGTLAATFTALLDDDGLIADVTLKGPLESFEAVAVADRPDLPLSMLLPGVLASFDLPDCYEALRPLGLRLIEPRGAGRVS